MSSASGSCCLHVGRIHKRGAGVHNLEAATTSTPRRKAPMDKEARGHYSDELNRFAGARDSALAGEITAGEDMRSRRLLPTNSAARMIIRGSAHS